MQMRETSRAADKEPQVNNATYMGDGDFDTVAMIAAERNDMSRSFWLVLTDAMSIVASMLESARVSPVTTVTSNSAKVPRTLLMARWRMLKDSSECERSSFQVPVANEG